MHILLELHMWENRYRQFKDQSWNCTCGKRGSNQKVELHMWENVSPLTWGVYQVYGKSRLQFYENHYGGSLFSGYLKNPSFGGVLGRG